MMVLLVLLLCVSQLLCVSRLLLRLRLLQQLVLRRCGSGHRGLGKLG